MNRKKWQKMIGLLIVMLALAACGGGQREKTDTAVSTAPDTTAAQPTVADTQVADTQVADSQAAEPAAVEADDSSEPDPAPAMAAEPKAEPETNNAAEPALTLTDLDGLADEEKAIQLLASEPTVAQFLADYPDWSGDSWLEDEENGVWSIDFYSEAEDEWLGWGQVNINSGEIVDYFVPRDLSPEEFQDGLARVEKLVLNDAGVQARLGDPDLWEHETSYNRWDENWEVYFVYGLDQLMVTVYVDEDSIYLEEIFDPARFEAEEAAQLQRDQAVELAWDAEGIDQALDGVDNWHTLVAPQGDLWAVSFVSDDQELFFALVDIDNQTIVEAE